MQAENTEPIPQRQGPAADEPALPLDIILLVLEKLPLERVFHLLDLDIMKEALVARLNQGEPIREEHLEYLIQHGEVFERLKTLDVVCYSKRDIDLVCAICSCCPNLLYLNLGLMTEDLLPFIKRGRLLRRMTELTMMVHEEETFCSLNEICKRSPKLRLKLAGLVLAQNLQKHPQILKKLTTLGVFYPEHLSSLGHICEQYPFTLGLYVEPDLEELVNCPGVLQSLARLELDSMIQDTCLDRLNDVCKRSPNLSEVILPMKGSLRQLLKHEPILVSLTDLSIDLDDQNDCFWLRDLHERCPRLTSYRITTTPASIKYIHDYSGLAEIIMSDNIMILHARKHHKSLKIHCGVEHLQDLAQMVTCQSLSLLTLTFTGIADNDEATLHSLEDISKKSPNLEGLLMPWSGSFQCSPYVARRLGETFQNWKNLRWIHVSPPVVREALWREWGMAGIEFPVINMGPEHDCLGHEA